MSLREVRALHCNSAVIETFCLWYGRKRAKDQNIDTSSDGTRELRGEMEELKEHLSA